MPVKSNVFRLFGKDQRQKYGEIVYVYRIVRYRRNRKAFFVMGNVAFSGNTLYVGGVDRNVPIKISIYTRHTFPHNNTTGKKRKTVKISPNLNAHLLSLPLEQNRPIEIGISLGGGDGTTDAIP